MGRPSAAHLLPTRGAVPATWCWRPWGGGAPCCLRLRRLLRRPRCRGHVLVAAPARCDPPFRGVGRGHAHEPQKGSPWQRGALVRQGRPHQGQRARPWGMSWGVTFRDAMTTHPWGPGACAEPGCDSAWPRAPAPACKPRTRTVRLSGRSRWCSSRVGVAPRAQPGTCVRPPGSGRLSHVFVTHATW